MANIGPVRNRAQLFMDALEQGTLPNQLRYSGHITGDGTPEAAEVFINGEEGSRFYLPTDSVAMGTLHMSAWNITDGDDPGGSIVNFMVENDGGTVNLLPADIDTTAVVANPVIRYDAAVAGLVMTVAADNVNKALVVQFTPTTNDEYKVAGVITYSFVSAASRASNYYATTV